MAITPTATGGAGKGVWTEGAVGPCEFNITATEATYHAYAGAEAPDLEFGHYRAAFQDITAEIPADVTVWVMAPDAELRFVVTLDVPE